MNLFYGTLIVLCFKVYQVELSIKNEQIIDIDLSAYDPLSSGKQVFKYQDILVEGNTVVNVANVSLFVGYFIIQVHTFNFPVTLSYNQAKNSSNYVNGTNIGLVQRNDYQRNYEFYVGSVMGQQVSVLFVVVAYDQHTPIPGGCNMIFNTEMAPYQQVVLWDDLIQVDAQPPSLFDILCEISKVQVEFYHLFLRERDYSESNYFKGIEKMLTVDEIRKNGKQVSDSQTMRRYYSVYRGTGSVITIIATAGNYSAAYVPTVSYGCDVYNWDDVCNGPVLVHWRILSAALIFAGIFICFFGHRFFKASLFFTGFLFGTLLLYFILIGTYSLESGDSIIASLVFGIVFGAVWVMLWWKMGIPLFSIYLSFILSGFLVTAVMYYSALQDLGIFHSDICYWLIVVTVTLSYSLILSGIAEMGHIIVCSLLGSYALVAALSIYFGANLHYIVINMARRITVEHFNLAVIDPPYQDKDINLTITWIFFLISGTYAQWWLLRGRPPFPPHRNASSGENSPLLARRNVRFAPYQSFD